MLTGLVRLRLIGIDASDASAALACALVGDMAAASGAGAAAVSPWRKAARAQQRKIAEAPVTVK